MRNTVYPQGHERAYNLNDFVNLNNFVLGIGLFWIGFAQFAQNYIFTCVIFLKVYTQCSHLHKQIFFKYSWKCFSQSEFMSKQFMLQCDSYRNKQ